ncbi:Leucine-, isoleucine-, valine-, threonine-, and alanine-binding protein precursor [compost metagenome]|uniref:ABC transporter substrate-binding protein n=1 Tax=Variovorax boronicumulans TaxID=436515 RepID=UPI000BB2EFDD|nr:ABC transporter substrate-binding protein [Variovorax boronicumulans]PBI87754.1 Leucine-, isoleucine-, valine-, threonine-, and alanine-binding protein precursor [Variovorax boronicumulans]
MCFGFSKHARRRLLQTLALVGALTAAAATAQKAERPVVVVGAVVSTTGPAATLGIPEKKALELAEALAKEDASLPFVPKLVVYDDGSDPTRAVNAVRKLANDDKAAVLICCTTTPGSMAVLDAVKSLKTLNISMASAASVVEPVAERFWTFKTPMTDRMQIAYTMETMSNQGVRRVAYLGLEDAYGEAGWNEFRVLAKDYGLEIVASERFARGDSNLTPQALKVRQAVPDAVYVHSIPPSSVLAHQTLGRVGFSKAIFHSAGAANSGFLNVAKGAVDGAYVVSGVIEVYDQLPINHPLRPALEGFAQEYGRRFPGEQPGLFAGQGWDAGKLAMMAIGAALRAGAKPTEPEVFRAVVRDQMERIQGHAGSNGVFNFSKRDHLGLDKSGIGMLKVVGGRFRLQSN